MSVVSFKLFFIFACYSQPMSVATSIHWNPAVEPSLVRWLIAWPTHLTVSDQPLDQTDFEAYLSELYQAEQPLQALLRLDIFQPLPTQTLPGSENSHHYLLTLAELNREPLSSAIPPSYNQQTIDQIRLIHRLLTSLIKTPGLNLSQLMEPLAPIKALDSYLFSTIEDGVRFALQGHWLAAAYILILQLESYLRELVEFWTGQGTVLNRHGYESPVLAQLLKQLKSQINPNLWLHLHWCLKDRAGLNLRNIIAHGLLKRQDAQPILVTATLRLFYLLSLELTKSPAERAGPGPF